nr:unnamed protein product [Callosobruchus analis]
MAISHLIETSDETYIIDNEALHDICYRYTICCYIKRMSERITRVGQTCNYEGLEGEGGGTCR